MAIEIIETEAFRDKPRFKIIPCVYVLLKNAKNEYLLGLRQNTGYADGLWALPAGHLDGQETARQGLKREAKEELDIDVAVDDMDVALVMHRINSSRECVDFFIEVKKWSGELKNNELDFCQSLKFFALDQLPETLIPYERFAFEALRQGKTYCEFGW